MANLCGDIIAWSARTVQTNHSTTSISTSLSRGLEESFGNESGCSRITTVEAESCSPVSERPSALEISRGSLYENTASGESTLNANKESPATDESVNESLSKRETRHLSLNTNSSSDTVQSSQVSSSRHFPKMSSVSPVVIDMYASQPTTLKVILLVAGWAEEECRKGEKTKTPISLVPLEAWEQLFPKSA